MRCVTESSGPQSAFPMKCLPVSGEKLNIVLMCVVPNKLCERISYRRGACCDYRSSNKETLNETVLNGADSLMSRSYKLGTSLSCNTKGQEDSNFKNSLTKFHCPDHTCKRARARTHIHTHTCSRCDIFNTHTEKRRDANEFFYVVRVQFKSLIKWSNNCVRIVTKFDINETRSRHNNFLVLLNELCGLVTYINFRTENKLESR
jgi:hypothetical protein